MGLTPEQVAAVAAILTTVIVTGLRGDWVWGRELKKSEERERIEAKRTNFWRDLALATLGHADKAIAIAAQKQDEEG